MISEEIKIWTELMTLCESSEAFFYADQFNAGRHYRIFNYRLASYTDFLLSSAIECRGIMFEITEEGKDAEMIRLAARPMQKFFNYRENPMTMDVDLSTVVDVWDKADGSLISSYVANGVLWAKSKGSLQSEQAVAATEMLQTEAYKDMAMAIVLCDTHDFTVNMEYVAPTNRIVLGYEKPDLIVLNVRHLYTGQYMAWEKVTDLFGDKACHRYNFEEVDAMVEFFAGLPDLIGIEGVVVRTSDDLWMKMKTEAYMTAHRAKDSINSDRRLFEAVLEEATDDLRALFFDDQMALDRISWMEDKVEVIYNHAVDQVERFYERNKELDRKDFAILGQKELDRPLFGLAMNKWQGKEVDYKAFLRKNYRDFGIKEDPKPTGDE